MTRSRRPIGHAPASSSPNRSPSAGSTRCAAAGLDVDVQTGLSPEQLLEAIKGAPALVIRSATQVTAEVLAAGDRPHRRRPGRHRPRQRRRRRGDAARRDGRQRAAVEHPLGGRAHARAAARAGAQRPAGERRPQGRASGTARSGKASSCTARRSASSASVGSACSSRSARTRSACGSSRTTRS